MIIQAPTIATTYIRGVISLLILLSSTPVLAQLMWSEEFDTGTVPDSSLWSYDLGAGGWGNQELQEYTNQPENVRIEDGNLVITALQKTTGFTSGRIRTENKVLIKYGTIEARIKVPNLEDGLWPAFWTLGNNFSTVGWPRCGEFDLMEMGWQGAINDGLVNRWVSAGAHWEHDGSHAAFGREYGNQPNEPADMNDEFHVFSMNWTPTSVTTFLDGVESWKMDISPESCTDCEEFHEPHFLLLNMAVGGTFTGLLNSNEITAAMPAEMLVDYIRIYDNGFTELSGSGAIVGPPDIGPGHSGSWFNEDQSGHGFSMEFAQLADGTPLAVIYWYTYDDKGNPIFMLGTGIPDRNRVEVAFDSPTGMIYGDFDPVTVNRDAGGTAVFEFSDSDTASFTYTPSDFSITTWGHTTSINELPLVRVFAIPAPQYFE
jgi:beta-glucanase (GH16 family)